jgi:hypothetical protein
MRGSIAREVGDCFEKMLCSDGRSMSKRKVILLIVLAALTVVVYTQVTFFVIQRIGAVPAGRTLLIWRTGKLKFIDSADGVCARESDGVSLLCRMAILDAVAQNSRVIARLPYSETLYLISTDGKKYDR